MAFSVGADDYDDADDGGDDDDYANRTAKQPFKNIIVTKFKLFILPLLVYRVSVC